MADFGSMSAADINASMGFGPGGVGDQSQAFINSMYGPMGFGGQTAAYSALGAAYGRDTGGFNAGYVGADPGADFWSGSRGSPAYTPDYGASLPGQPYGPGYFDNTFGAANSQPQQTGFSPYNTYGQPGSTSAGTYGDPFSGGGHWDMSAGWVSDTPAASFNDRYGAAPPVNPSLQPVQPALPQVMYDGGYPQTFNDRFSNVPTTPNTQLQMPQFIMNQGGDTGGIPGMHYDMRQGWVPDSGGTNLYGYPGSGSIGQQDAFGGIPQLQQRMGGVFDPSTYAPSPISQPYGPAYFDNTFGSSNASNTAGGGIPGMHYDMNQGWLPDDPAALARSRSGYDASGQNANTYGFPGSGVVGPQQDTFSGWPYQGGQSGFDYRFPQGMPPAVDVQAQIPQAIQDLQRTLGIIDRSTAGGQGAGSHYDMSIGWTPNG